MCGHCGAVSKGWVEDCVRGSGDAVPASMLAVVAVDTALSAIWSCCDFEFAPIEYIIRRRWMGALDGRDPYPLSSADRGLALWGPGHWLTAGPAPPLHESTGVHLGGHHWLLVPAGAGRCAHRLFARWPPSRRDDGGDAHSLPSTNISLLWLSSPLNPFLLLPTLPRTGAQEKAVSPNRLIQYSPTSHPIFQEILLSPAQHDTRLQS